MANKIYSLNYVCVCLFLQVLCVLCVRSSPQKYIENIKMKFNRKGIFFFYLLFGFQFCVFCQSNGISPKIILKNSRKKNIHTPAFIHNHRCMTHKPFGTENENEKKFFIFLFH